MLTGVLLKDRKSIRISGDYSDIQSLQKTIAKVIQLFQENQLADTDASQLFTDFHEKLKSAGNSSWMELLMIFNFSVSLSDYIVTDSSDDINLFLLEDILQNTANIYPTGDEIQRKGFIGKRFVFNNLKSFIKEFSYDKKLINEPHKAVPTEKKTTTKK